MGAINGILMGVYAVVPVPLLTNEFDVLSILHGQMSLAAVNQICVIKGLLRKGKYKRDDLLNSLHVG